MYVDLQNNAHQGFGESLDPDYIDVFQIAILIYLTRGFSDDEKFLSPVKVFSQAALKLTVVAVDIHQLRFDEQGLYFVLEIGFQAMVLHELEQINKRSPL